MFAASDLCKIWKEKGKARTLHFIREGIEKKDFGPYDFSLRDMAEQLIPNGHEFVNRLDPRRKTVLEDAASVDTSAFSSINRQILFSAINEAMQLDTLIGDFLCTTMPSNLQEDELIPGITVDADDNQGEIGEGQDYPLAGLAEEKVRIPRAEKHGKVLGITREAIIGDRTGILIERGRSLGTSLAIRREKAIIDVVIGGVNPYVRNDIARNTYANIAGTSYFDNIITDVLVNYTDIQAASALWNAMSEPNIGEPLMHDPDTLIVCPTLSWTAGAILTDVGVTLQQALTRATAPDAMEIASSGGNRIPWKLTLRTNEWVTRRLIHHTGNGGLTSN
ncbi:MAG TPA: hypothetical protein VMX74_05085, partial [Pirellulales bacterium]|nr:hypothetical protein [Pirellulales bacterium]